jgi:hypothetical protein
MALENGMVRVNFLSKLVSGQAISNTFYLHDDGAGAPPAFDDMVTLGEDIGDWFGDAYKGLLQEDDTFQSITVYQVADPTAPEPVLEATNHVNLAGTLGPGPRGTPDSISGLISFKTPNASRRYRGHLFIPGTPDPTDLNGDIFVPTGDYADARTALQGNFQAGIITAITWTGDKLPDYNLVIFSKTAALAAAASTANVSAVINDNRVHWLRSRERGAS